MERDVPLLSGCGVEGEWTEGELAGIAARGNKRAFEALVVAYQRRVYGFACRYLRDREEADDLAQEIFLRLYRKLDRFDAARPFEPWFWKLAARVSSDYIEKRAALARQVPLDDASAREVGESPTTHLGLETTIGSAMAQLPRSYRLALLLHYELGLPLQEVAEVTGLTVPAVKSRLYRARLVLQRELCREEPA